jgi:SSS family solute:Na+ symporter
MAFVCTACLIGLYAAARIPGTQPDQAFFTMLNATLPNGVMGLAYAGVLAVIMSTVDSIFIGACAVFSHDLLPFIAPSQQEKFKDLRHIRVINLALGLLCGAVAYLLPSVVSLSILASYICVCFAPSMLAALFNWKLSAWRAKASILSGLAVLAATWPFLNNNSFLLVFVAIFLPLLLPSVRRAKNAKAI